MDSDFFLTPNGTNLFLKPLVMLIMVDKNQAFLSQLGEDIYKDDEMDIMEKVNHAAKPLI